MLFLNQLFAQIVLDLPIWQVSQFSEDHIAAPLIKLQTLEIVGIQMGIPGASLISQLFGFYQYSGYQVVNPRLLIHNIWQCVNRRLAFVKNQIYQRGCYDRQAVGYARRPNGNQRSQE